MILKDVTISRGTVVFAGSIVTKEFTFYNVAEGVPTKTIKIRFRNDKFEKHKELLDYVD